MSSVVKSFLSGNCMTSRLYDYGLAETGPHAIVSPKIVMTENHEQLPSHFHQALAQSVERAVDFPPGLLVTLVRAEITGDAKYAKGTVSALPESEGKRALDILNACSPDIKEELNRRIRLRRIPDLRWVLDTTEGKAAEIENIINDLEEKGEL